MAEEKPYLTGRTYLFKLPKGKDLLEELIDFCHDNQVKCGTVSVVGMVSNATIGYYDQAKKKFEKSLFDEEMELLNLTGNVSIQDNRPMVQAYVTLADKEHTVIGGRLFPGTKIYVCEAFIQELVGEPKVRRSDKVTKLSLWN